MLHHILYLITLDKPDSESGKIIIYSHNGHYETHWTMIVDQEEETDIVYSGTNIEQAWSVADEIRHTKCKEGFHFSNPWFMATFTAIPQNHLLLRKLECFSDRNKDNALFQDLKKWRRATASTANIPPYFIATDKLLHLISTFIPHQPEELKQIPGIGNHKFEQYGSAILELTNKYKQVFSFPLDWVTTRISDADLANWLLDQNLLKQEKKKLQEKQEQDGKLKLLEAIHQQVPIDEVCERLSFSNMNLMVRIRQLAKEGYEVLPYLQKEVERVQDRQKIQDLVSTLGTQRLKPIYEQMYGSSGENILPSDRGKKYNMIRLICTYLQLTSAA